MFLKFFEVFRVSFPVFSLIVLGLILGRKQLLTPVHTAFLNRLIYHWALPPLIFAEVCRQPFTRLFNPAMISACIGATSAICLLYWIAAKLLRLKGAIAAAFVFGTFWANVAYMGFPLSASAYGQEEGLALAAIVNAFAMPLFILLGMGLIALEMRNPKGNGNGNDNNNRTAQWKRALSNPIALAALLGILVSLLVLGPDGHGGLREYLPGGAFLGRSFVDALKLLGSMGLPLALLSIGAGLRWQTLTGQSWVLLLTLIGKLIITPFFAYWIFHSFFPSTPKPEQGVAVLLMGTPIAVASYVIAREQGIVPDFVSALLVWSTIGSMLTLPVWLYILL